MEFVLNDIERSAMAQDVNAQQVVCQRIQRITCPPRDSPVCRNEAVWGVPWAEAVLSSFEADDIACRTVVMIFCCNFSSVMDNLFQVWS